MRAPLTLLFGFALTLPSTAWAKCSRLRFEPRRNISITEFGQLTARPESVDVRGGSFTYWRFDPEDAPERNGWNAMVVVLAATGDLGEKPVGGIIWAEVQPEETAGLRAMREKDSVKFDFSEKRLCSEAPIILEWRSNNRIYANGVFVGQVHDR